MRSEPLETAELEFLAGALGPGWSAEDEITAETGPAAQAANRFSTYLRRAGFWPTEHFTLRFLERALPLGLDPRTFRSEFYGARHFSQTRPGYNTRIALIRDIPVLYRPSGFKGERIKLVGLLPQGTLPPSRPIHRPRQRETELLSEMEMVGITSEGDAIRIATSRGVRDENGLTDMVFFARHPERQGRALSSNEQQLIQEWIGIRDRLVRPALRAVPGRTPPQAPGAPQWVRDVAPLLNKYRGDIPLEFLLGWINIESGGNILSHTSLDERGYFQLHPDESRTLRVDHQLLSNDKDYSVRKGIELANHYSRLTEARGVPRGSEAHWAIVKLWHWLPLGIGAITQELRRQGIQPGTWGELKNFILSNRERLNDVIVAYREKHYGQRDLPQNWDVAHAVGTIDRLIRDGRQLAATLGGARDLEAGTGAASAPKGLVLLQHTHIPKTPAPAAPSGFRAGAPAALIVADMNPGFINANDEVAFDTSGSGLQTCLRSLIASNFSELLASPKQTQPAANDRVRVAIVDLTGEKLANPDFAGWGSTVAMYGASVPKVLALYAAHQLRSDLTHLAAQASISSGPALENAAVAEWKKRGLTRRLPDLVWLFDIRKSSSGSSPGFSAVASKVMANISFAENPSAGTLIAKLGFPYIGSVAWQAGLYHPQRGGLWLNHAYGEGVWSGSPVHAPFSHNATALSAAMYLTLLAQGRLVDDAASAAIEQSLSTGNCVTPFFLRAALPPIRAGKCGLYGESFHDCVLIEDDQVRYVLAVLSRLTTSKQKFFYTQLCTALDGLIRRNNQAPKPACS
jgi:hypothetical protein